MKRLLNSCIIPMLIVTALILGQSVISIPVAASAPLLSVEGTLVRVNMQPGDSHVHTMTVSSGSPLEMTVEACGFGQSEDGSYIPLKPEEDTSPFTARPFIINIDRPTFTLSPGSPVTVKATIKVPAGTPAGTRFALINIYSKPSGTSRVGVVLANAVPVICTVGQFNPSKTGKITELHASKARSGQMITVRTRFRNTGNTLFKVKNRVTVIDSLGKEVASYTSPETNISIIPTYYRIFEAPISLTDVTRPLPPGKYRIDSRILLSNPGFSDDGMLLDSMRSEYAVDQPYIQHPNLDVNSLVTVSVSSVAEAKVNALEPAGTVVDLKQLNPAEGGKIVVARFTQEPTGIVPFSAPKVDGGMDKTALKFVDVRAEGYSQGIARIHVSFDESEVKGWNVSSFFLAYFDGARWVKCDNIHVDAGAGVVSGEIKVAQLTGTVIALGGERYDVTTPTPSPKITQPQSGGSTVQPTPALSGAPAPQSPPASGGTQIQPVTASGQVASLPSPGTQASTAVNDSGDTGMITAAIIIGFGLLLAVVLVVVIARRRASYRYN